MIVKQSLINLAIEEANKGDHRQKVGCVLFDKKVILSKGHNTSQKSSRKLHPKFQRWPHSVHAEVDSILKARKDLKGSSLLVIRVNSKQQFRLSKPCLNCMKYIEYVGIKKIFYSIDRFPYIVEYKL